MGSDIQRALLWILFGLSAFMLYDRWEVYNGRPSFFGAETQQVATTEAPKNEAALPSQSQTASLPAEAKTAVKAEPIQVETDLLKLSFDPEGAVIIGSELRKEKQTIPWTDTGLVGMILGNKADTPADVVLFTEQKGSHYGIKVSHEVVNNTASEIKPSVYYQLTRDGEKPEGESTMVNAYTGAAVYTDKDKFQKVSFSDIADGDKDFQAKADNGWIARIQHYFVSAWVPTQGVERENYTNTVGEKLYAVGSIQQMDTIAPNSSKTIEATLYSGPQDQTRLDAIAPGLSLVVDYGWLTFLAKPIYWLLSFLYGIVGNWGWAIVLLTCIVKAILYPLSLAGYRSMAKMKDLGPRMKALKEKYGDDKQRLNMAMMEMYKTEKINPVGGCLPIALQLPVFLALYWVLLASVELRDAPWIFWVTDLAAPDPWFILPILMIITMVIQFKLNPTPPDPVQAKMMAIMPFVFGIMFIFFASGLVLYWLINNILSIIQQYVVNKQIEADRIKRQSN